MKLRQLLKYLVEDTVQKQTKPRITEGIYDPGILKAIFLVGGPGSGKSFVINSLFGIDSKISFSRHGLKLITPDPKFEKFLLQAQIDPRDLDNISKNDPKRYQNDVEPLRQRAKDLTNKFEDNYLIGRLGLILEGTGKNVESIKTNKQKLEKLGYDCFLIFVNTDLETAKKRNSQRDRTIPEDVLSSLWNSAQKNLGSLQSVFGAANTLIVDNSQDSQLGGHISKAVDTFIGKPVSNSIGVDWIRNELKKRKR